MGGGPVSIGPGGFDAEGRTEEEERQWLGQREGLDEFPSPTTPGGSIANEEGDIGAEFGSEFLQAGRAEFGLKYRVQGDQDGGSVAAATTEARAHGNAFGDFDLGAEFVVGHVRKKPGSAADEVVIAHRDIGLIADDAEVAAWQEIDRNIIGERERNHEGFEIVKSIGPTLQDAEMQVDFRGRAQLH